MRLIDGDTLWEKLEDEPWYDNADRDEIALPIVAAAPTVDAVIVTRCKDCKYAYINSFSASSGVALCTLSGQPMQQDDFCSYGERREDA